MRSINKICKKNISVFLILLMGALSFGSVLPGQAYAKQAPTPPSVELKTVPGVVHLGDTFDVSVSVQDVAGGVYGAEVSVIFDPTFVDMNSYNKGAGFGEVTLAKDMGNHEILAASARPNPDTGKYDMLKINFTAKKQGTAKFTINTKFITYNGSQLVETSIPTQGEDVTIYAIPGGGGGGGDNQPPGGKIKLPGAAGPGENPFIDVPADHWAVNDIVYLYSRHIIGGFSDGTFRPNRVTTRGELAVMMAKALELKPGSKGGPGHFSDVSQSHWAFNQIEAMAEAGLISGSKGKFRPGDSVTREQMVVMIINALHRSGKVKPPTGTDNSGVLARFKDKDKIPEWARGPIAEAVNLGLVSGIKSNEFGAGSTATRAQVAVLINKMLKLMDSK